MVKSDTQLYKFGKFQVDTVKRVLLSNDGPMQLPSRAFDVLLALVEHNQYVIDKEELMRLVWGDRVVEENNLTRHISTLRKVLDESPNDHRYIVTVPGRGYSFVAPVERIPINGSDPVAAGYEGADASFQVINAAGSPNLQGLVAAGRVSRIRSLSRIVKPNRWVVAISLLVIVSSIGLLGFTLLRSRPVTLPLTRNTLNTFRDWEITRLTRGGVSLHPAISRDGRLVAYINHESGRNTIWILQLATSTQQQLTPPDNLTYCDLMFSADGSELYILRLEGASSLGTLYRMPVVGGVAKKLRDDVTGTRIMMSRDGTRLAFLRRSEEKSELVLANTEAVEERVLLSRDVEFPAWSPNGDLIAFSVGNAESGGEGMGLHEIRLSDGAEKEITPQKWQHAGDKVWLPDGSGLLVSARDIKTSIKKIWLVAYPSGEARPLSSDLDQLSHINLSSDAALLVAEQNNLVSDIWSVPIDDAIHGTKIGVWGSGGLCLMPNGRIVYSALSSEPTHELWIMNPDGTERKQLTFDTANDLSPAVSPDGRYIAFASNRTGHFEIWRMSPDGSNLVRMTHTDGASQPSISPDSKWLIYLSSGSLHKLPIEGGEPAKICDQAVGFSTVSPDSKLIAYFARGKDAYVIAVSSFDDGAMIKKFEVGSNSLNHNSLKWTPDGKALLYSLSSDGAANIWMQPLDGSPSRQVTDFKTDGLFHFDLFPEGKNLICSRGGFKHDVILIKNLR
jgi:Tol biopolymer transport system component/DNA-binding winged helix-turn-helix (wHTH) protein